METGMESTYEAYAPCPIVLLTIRNGRFDGRGAAWLPGGAGAISPVLRVFHKNDESLTRLCNPRPTARFVDICCCCLQPACRRNRLRRVGQARARVAAGII